MISHARLLRMRENLLLKPSGEDATTTINVAASRTLSWDETRSMVGAFGSYHDYYSCLIAIQSG